MVETVWARDKRIRGAELTMGQTFYLVTLNQFIGNNPDAWPSQQKLADAMNASKRAVQKWQEELDAMGVIIVDVGQGRSSTNRYRLNLDALQPKRCGNDEQSAPFTVIAQEQMTNRVRPNDEQSAPEMTNPVRTERTVERTEKEHSVNEHFSEWYKAYPRKVGKGDAEKAYRKALKSVAAEMGTESQAVLFLLEAAREFANSPAGKQGTFTPHPATWLNKARYHDDRAEWARGFNKACGPQSSGSGNAQSSALWQKIVAACVRLNLQDRRYPEKLASEFGVPVADRVLELKLAAIKSAADKAAGGNDFDLRALERRFNGGGQA